MGPIVSLVTSLLNYHYTLCNSVEERRSHLLRVVSLKSWFICLFVCYLYIDTVDSSNKTSIRLTINVKEYEDRNVYQ